MESPVAPSSAHDLGNQASSSQQDDNGDDDPNRKKSNVRKRTKTGCLTCRRRRIKCDEGRPICNNCIKSRRHCEGYNQRVVFKNPYGAFEGSYGPTVYPPGPSDLMHQSDAHAGVAGSSSQGAFPAIAPKPPAFGPQHQQFQHQLQNLPFPPPIQGSQPSGEPSVLDFNQTQFPGSAYPLPNPLIPLDLASNFEPFDTSGQQQFEGSALEHSGLPGSADRFIGSSARRRHPRAVSYRSQNQPGYDAPDDDDSMPSSGDEEEEDPRHLIMPVLNTMGPAGTQVRVFSAFAQSNAVFEYMHSPHAAGFQDEGRKTVFMHFVNVTGPSMSLYERRPFDQAKAETGSPKSEDGESLWSYTFPVISLNHPGLLQAMLAIGSLQISKLQGTPSTAALKHYHVALRRVAKNLTSISKRVHPATLAATLLLAYFEVWSSDHSKWCNHLFGARILLREIPLKQMSQICLPLRLMKYRRQELETQTPSAAIFPTGTPFGDPPGHPNHINFDLLSTITGYYITPEDYGLGENQYLDEATLFTTTEKDIEKYENLRDLFWWYCKMDVYQSILGGTRLFMEYEHWTQCPPRAPVNKIAAIYGTYDHLILLLGRLANFASRDVARKRKVKRAQEAAMGGSRADTGSPPPFPGLIPTQERVEVPMGFETQRPSAKHSQDNDLDSFITAQEALQEWEAIRLAFQTLEKHFGSEFLPLQRDFMDHSNTPFGGVLQFRTYSVAGIWMNYYMGLIVLHRSHPSMPPAAMQAAGVAESRTATFANQIGRIAAGLSDDPSGLNQISTLLGAAYIESSFCLFVAGIQYNEDSKRRWIVQRVLDISRLTGWQSARQIAEGCESCWVKVHAMGRGPPYTPRLSRNVPGSVWQNPRRIDRRIHELDSAEDKQLVLTKSEQAHFALGLLGVEEDLQVLRLRDED